MRERLTEGITRLHDTAASAAALLAFYEGRGFQVVDRIQWSAVNYPSVVLARPPQMPASFP